MLDLAFLPQFVDPARGNLALQLFTLGSVFVLMAVVTDSLYALLAGTVGESLKNAPYFLKAERYLVGSVYIGLGLTAAFSDIGNK
jgi:threonine/homoserine/homoserine lactone efflux protein